MTGESIVDMQRGVYRRVYAGFIWGDRINSVSMEAEAWFWRLHAVADDLGNLPGMWQRLAGEAGGRRNMTAADAERLTGELIAAGLIEEYQSGGDRYLHIRQFESRQPAGKNGRRIQRYPEHPTETLLVNPGVPGGIRVNPGESKGIRVCPGESVPPSPSPIPSPTPTPTPTPGNPVVVVETHSGGQTDDPKYAALIFAGVGIGKARELAALPYFTLESIRRVADSWKQQGKHSTGAMVKAFETAAEKDRLYAARKRELDAAKAGRTAHG